MNKPEKLKRPFSKTKFRFGSYPSGARAKALFSFFGGALLLRTSPFLFFWRSSSLTQKPFFFFFSKKRRVRGPKKRKGLNLQIFLVQGRVTPEQSSGKSPNRVR